MEFDKKKILTKEGKEDTFSSTGREVRFFSSSSSSSSSSSTTTSDDDRNRLAAH